MKKTKFPTDRAYFIGIIRDGKYKIGWISKYSNQGVGTRYGTKEEAQEEVIKRLENEISRLNRAIDNYKTNISYE